MSEAMRPLLLTPAWRIRKKNQRKS